MRAPRRRLAMLLVIAGASLVGPAGQVIVASTERDGDCVQSDLIERSRCERQALMQAACAATHGARRTACEREQFLAHPLVCPARADNECPCALERYVVEVCRAEQGPAFEGCLRHHGDFGVAWGEAGKAAVGGRDPDERKERSS